jgi:hypothetical protein
MHFFTGTTVTKNRMVLKTGPYLNGLLEPLKNINMLPINMKDFLFGWI